MLVDHQHPAAVGTIVQENAYVPCLKKTALNKLGNQTITYTSFFFVENGANEKRLNMTSITPSSWLH